MVDIAPVYASAFGDFAQVKTGKHAFVTNHFERHINEFLLCFSGLRRCLIGFDMVRFVSEASLIV